MNRLPLRLGAILIASAFVLAACGGSSSNKTGSTTPITPSGGAGPTGSSPGSTTPITTGNSGIDALIAKAKSANVKVTYADSSKSNAPFTLIQYNGDSALITDNSSIYTVKGTTYTCQGTGATAKCFSIPGGAGLGSLTTAYFGIYASLFTSVGTAGANPYLNVTHEANQTIAGRDAVCNSLKASALTGATGQITACVDAKDGVFLKGSVSGTSSGGSLEATSYANSTADDVKLPATPTAAG